MNLSSKVSLLALLARRDPRIWEIIHPHVPMLSEGTRHVLASMVVKFVAKDLKDEGLAHELHGVGKQLFEQGVSAMSYEDDDWCGTPWPHHRNPDHLGPQPEPWSVLFGLDDVMLNPQPLPPKEKTYYGALLVALADTIKTSSAAETLRNLGSSMMHRVALHQ